MEPFGYRPRRGIARSYDNFIFSSLNNLHIAPQWLYQFHTTLNKGSFSKYSPISAVICFLSSSFSDWGLMESQSSLIFISLMVNDVELFFKMFAISFLLLKTPYSAP